MNINKLENAVEIYANVLISLFLRSACEALDDDDSFTKWPREVNDLNETNVTHSWRERLDKPSDGRPSSKELNELIAHPPSPTESASSTLPINKFNIINDLIEPMTSVCLTHDPEKKNELEKHVLETTNNLLVQLKNDLPIDKDLTTKAEDKLPSDFQVCLFVQMNYFQVSNGFF